MNKQEWIEIVHNASISKMRVSIEFDHPVSICIHGKWQPKRKQITLRFFQLFNEDNVITGYGYKQRSNETHGYSINNIPWESIVSVSYPDKTIDPANEKEVFKKWVLRNLDVGVWPEMETNIDSILSTLKPSEYTRIYTKSLGHQLELEKVQRLFDDRLSGTVVLSKRNNVFVETSQREKGFYAWLVVGERSYTMLNPKVAILPRK
jgi:hypothetical protein